MVVGCPAVLAVVVFVSCCVDVGHGFSSAVSCPIELLSCLGNGECGSCLQLLQDTDLTIAGIEFELCSELYAGMCGTADSIGCDTDNDELADVFACFAEDQFGCDDFTTCAEATAGLDEPTEAPAPVPSAAPATPAPSIAATTTAIPAATPAPAAPTFPTPVFPLPTAAPSPGSRGNFSPSTAVPTAGGPGALGTAFPSPAMFESSTDTMAPSRSSAAPTGVDGLRGGGGTGGAFSAAPTAAPTGFEGLDDLEDGTNGGISSRHATGTTARCIVFAAVLAGLSSALAAPAV